MNTFPDDHPALPSPDELAATFASLAGWEARLRHLIQLGARLPALAPAQRLDRDLVQGCDTPVWLLHRFVAETGRLRFQADSDARIVRGLLAAVLVAVDDRTPAEILAFDLGVWFGRLGLLEHLSASRRDGVRAIVAAVQAVARRYA
ncbi:MAG TPA: SufE family protein [Candidatus Competibacteraceae bacterium]|nr:SufE family protein [Candidatus Competibacteraceae bacterium]